MEEFQESEVVFQEKPTGNSKETRYPKSDNKMQKTDKKKPKKTTTNKLVPMSIREQFSGSSWINQYLQSHSFDHDDRQEDELIVPPHVILERRMARKVAFSLCSGNGRTLKGRDLRQVRDSILKMTGFLES
ncbi:protein S40-1-like [Rutidosis leptorrhynchoides]|uniref:protein S40-1-like n=1 Tax=Rutidosis leptorrhynchoides TaxID=125765 RepID=UPI003A99213B